MTKRKKPHRRRTKKVASAGAIRAIADIRRERA
jgi:hypothetical protein